jgi:hypothetical protein
MKVKFLFSFLILTLGFQLLNADAKQDKCASFRGKDACTKYREKASPKKPACQWKFDKYIMPFSGECLTVSDYERKVKEEKAAREKEETERNFCYAMNTAEECNKADQKISCGWLTHPSKPETGRCIIKDELERVLDAEDTSGRRPKRQEAIQMSREDYFRALEFSPIK